jgi:preprotein translocase subunit SecG
MAWSHYLYTDDNVQLWNYRKGADFHMFNEQGRYLTDLLSAFFFSSIDTISQVRWLHLFSLLGWLFCLPVWYFVFNRIVRKEGLHPMIPFFAVLYLICCLPFTESIVWATMMELFIANTAALIAGYILYSSRSAFAIIPAIVFALISLFSYQSGIGCFLLPFLLQLIAKQKLSRNILLGIGIYFVCFILYDVLFHLQLIYWHIDISNRAQLASNPLNKTLFFLGRPLACAFRLNWIVNEKSVPGMIVYALILIAYVLMNTVSAASRGSAYASRGSAYTSRGSAYWFSRLHYLLTVLGLLVLIYLPSLAVKENWASNRTLLALDMAAFLLLFTSLLRVIGTERNRRIMALVFGFVVFVQAEYNLRFVFLGPITQEYRLVRSYIEANYTPETRTISFIRPSNDLFQRKYGVNSSWDEFGIPSFYPEWVPDPFVRQIVFEKTGSRSIAGRLVIQNWKDAATWRHSDTTASSHVLLVDVERILQ